MDRRQAIPKKSKIRNPKPHLRHQRHPREPKNPKSEINPPRSRRTIRSSPLHAQWTDDKPSPKNQKSKIRTSSAASAASAGTQKSKIRNQPSSQSSNHPLFSSPRAMDRRQAIPKKSEIRNPNLICVICVICGTPPQKSEIRNPST